MSDIDLNIIDDGAINLTLYDDGTVNVSVADDGDLNVTFDGPSSFQTLSDTPSSYTGESGKVVTVKSSEDGIEFTTAGEGNVSTSGTPVDNDFAKFIDGTDIEGRSYTEVRTDLNIEDGADVTDSTNVASAGAAMAGGAFHDGFSDFVANEHLDWTSDQGATNINAGNYTDTGDTTAHASFSQLDYASAGHTGFAPALTGDQNYVTDNDITLLGNTSGANSGDNAVNSNYSGLVSNVSTNLSLGTKTATTMNVNSSDGNNATLVEADTTNAGILGSDKWDEIVANTAKVSYPGSADSTELNILEGATLSTTEINYVKGVTSLIQTQLNAKVSYTKTNVKGHIAHGATASTARPTGFTSVEWVGSVEPTNAVNGDTWVDTA